MVVPGGALLTGARIGITADRRAGEQAALVRALGGVPVLGPALAADAPAPLGALVREIDAALAGPLDAAVFLTGVGAELILEAADRAGRGPPLRAALAGARVLARGPKPRAALRAAGVRLDEVADPARVGRVLALLGEAPLRGRRVLVQGWGPPPRELADPLRAAGAEVVELSPYASGWPRDPRPAQELARAAAAGRLEAISFTSATAVRQLAVLAEAAGVPTAEIAAGGALIAAVGPVTREAVLAEGLPVHVEPEPPRMGALYRAIAAAIAASSAPDIRLRRRAEGDAPAEAAAAASPG